MQPRKSPLYAVPNSYQPPTNEPAFFKASGLLADGHTAAERLMTLLGVTSLPPLLTEEAAEEMLSIGAENVVPNIPATLGKFVQMYCSPAPFMTEAARTAWMHDNAWCPVANVPQVACAQPPATFASEADRAAWMHANPTCPPPPAFCPPPPSFRSAEERANWAAANPTCPAPAPYDSSAAEDHVCPVDEPHCHDVVAEPVAAPVPAKSGFWKGVALAAAAAGGLWYADKHGILDRMNPSAKQIMPIAIGGAAIVGAVILLKPASANAMTAPEASRPLGPPAPPPSLPAAPPPVTADTRIAHGEQFTTAAPGTPAAIVTRLNNTPASRPIFAFQALMYSYGMTPYLPDGATGAHTTAMIHVINQLAQNTNPDTFTPGLYAIANDKLSAAGHSLNKIIPSLPANTIHLVNQAIVAMAPGAPLLQVHTA